MHGGAGNDTLYGASGGTDSTDAVILYGDAGDDILHGQSGNDYLYGGSGSDLLYGEAGADHFVFEAGATDAGAGTDTIEDFSIAQGDVLDFHGLLTFYSPLTSAITDFIQITTSGPDSIVAVDTKSC